MRVSTIETLKFKVYNKFLITLTRIVILSIICTNYMKNIILKNDMFKFLIMKTFNNLTNTIVFFTIVMYFISA